jgi:hypothetical protein
MSTLQKIPESRLKSMAPSVLATAYRAAEWHEETKVAALATLLGSDDCSTSDLLAVAEQELDHPADDGKNWASIAASKVVAVISERCGIDEIATMAISSDLGGSRRFVLEQALAKRVFEGDPATCLVELPGLSCARLASILILQVAAKSRVTG